MKASHNLWVTKPTTFADRLRLVWKNAKAYMEAGKADGRYVMYEPGETESLNIQDMYKDKYYTGD